MIAILLWACDEPETIPYKEETIDIPIPTQQRHQYEVLICDHTDQLGFRRKVCNVSYQNLAF